MLLNLLIVGAAGAAGAAARYLMVLWIESHAGGGFPWGTLAVNAVGCLAIGVLMHLIDQGTLGAWARPALAAGLLGGFTTFSAFGWETLRLIQSGAPGLGLANAAGSVVLGCGAAWAGWSGARLLFGDGG